MIAIPSKPSAKWFASLEFPIEYYGRTYEAETADASVASGERLLFGICRVRRPIWAGLFSQRRDPCGASTENDFFGRLPMSKNKAFATELQAISSSVDQDVGRVMTLLRDDATIQRKSSEPPDEPSSDDSSASEVPQRNRSPRTSQSSKSVSRSAVDGRATLENVTTRLISETNELLSDAALRQKLARRKPDSRQDIIEEAVCMWLRENGYRNSELDTDRHTPQQSLVSHSRSNQK